MCVPCAFAKAECEYVCARLCMCTCVRMCMWVQFVCAHLSFLILSVDRMIAQETEGFLMGRSWNEREEGGVNVCVSEGG